MAPQHRGPERHPDQVRQQPDRVRARRGPGARWLGRAAEHRARERPGSRASERHQERQCLDRHRRPRRAGGAQDRARGGAEGAEHQRAVRSVEVRHQRDRGGGARRSHRRRPHRADDPAVPRLMALHRRRHDLHSAGDPELNHRPLPDRQHAQHHDARRARARRRHSRRQFHGDDREHAPAIGGGRQAAARGDALRLGRHRRADAGLHAVDQLRVRLRDLSRRSAQVSVCAAGSGRRAGDARLLRPVANADADHHRAAAAAARLRTRPRARRKGFSAAFTSASSRASSTCARATCCCLRPCWRAATSCRSSAACCSSWGPSSTRSWDATSIH